MIYRFAPGCRNRTLIVFALALAGCQQQMAHQPAYRPLEASSLFPDGRSARPIVPGTVRWDQELRQGPLYTGQAATGGAYLDAIPVAPDKLPEFLTRGRQRFDIYCAPCHDRAGTGHGMIVERGFTEPPSYHTDLSRGYQLKGEKKPLTEVPVGYLFAVITDGYGAMPSYGKQVPPDDRWAIVSYVRALQISRQGTLADVSDPKVRERLEAPKGGGQ